MWLGPVDHHLGDRLVVQQRLERPEPGDVVDHLLDEMRPLLAGDGVAVEVDDPVDDPLDPQPDLGVGHVEQLVERADDLGLEAQPDLVEERRPGGVGRVHHGNERGGRGGFDGRGRRRRCGWSACGWRGGVVLLLRPLDPLHQRHDARSPLR